MRIYLGRGRRWLIRGGFGALLILLADGPLSATPSSQRVVDSLQALLRQPLPVAERVRALSLLVKQYDLLGPDSAIAAGRRAVVLGRQLPDATLLYDALQNLGVSYGKAHRMPEAISTFEEILRLTRRHPSAHAAAEAYTSLAIAYSTERQLPQTDQYFRKAIAIARQANLPETQANAERLLGSYLQEHERLAEAVPVLQHALRLFTEQGDRVQQAYTRSHLAEVALSQQRFAEAMSQARRAITMLPPSDPYALACLHDLLNRAAVGAGLPRAAVQYGRQAVAYAHAAQMPAVEADILHDLSQAYEAAADYENAYRTLVRRTALYDSVFTKERENALNEVLGSYEAEKKQAEIRALRQRNRIQHLQVERQQARVRTLTYSALGLGVGLLVVGGLLWQLARSRRALRQANRNKDLLISLIGHDLRTPVAAFQQVVPLLRFYVNRPDPAALQELTDELEKGAGRLAALLDNLLYWARAQSDQVVNQPAATDLNRLGREALTLYEPTARAKQLTLQLQASPSLAPAWADPALLSTVVRNLLSNALKFTPAGGTITLSLHPAATNRVLVTVSDTGVGLSARQLLELQTAARATTTVGTAGERGTGLGVAVCRTFVRLLGGELRISSAPGQGTTFSFELPTVPATVPAPAVAAGA